MGGCSQSLFLPCHSFLLTPCPWASLGPYCRLESFTNSSTGCSPAGQTYSTVGPPWTTVLVRRTCSCTGSPSLAAVCFRNGSTKGSSTVDVCSIMEPSKTCKGILLQCPQHHLCSCFSDLAFCRDGFHPFFSPQSPTHCLCGILLSFKCFFPEVPPSWPQEGWAGAICVQHRQPWLLLTPAPQPLPAPGTAPTLVPAFHK